MLADGNSEIANYYRQIAKNVIAELEAQDSDAGPEIVFQ
jgi:hypothetical protein